MSCGWPRNHLASQDAVCPKALTPQPLPPRAHLCAAHWRPAPGPACRPTPSGPLPGRIFPVAFPVFRRTNATVSPSPTGLRLRQAGQGAARGLHRGAQVSSGPCRLGDACAPVVFAQRQSPDDNLLRVRPCKEVGSRHSDTQSLTDLLRHSVRQSPGAHLPGTKQSGYSL